MSLNFNDYHPAFFQHRIIFYLALLTQDDEGQDEQLVPVFLVSTCDMLRYLGAKSSAHLALFRKFWAEIFADVKWAVRWERGVGSPAAWHSHDQLTEILSGLLLVDLILACCFLCFAEFLPSLGGLGEHLCRREGLHVSWLARARDQHNWCEVEQHFLMVLVCKISSTEATSSSGWYHSIDVPMLGLAWFPCQSWGTASCGILVDLLVEQLPFSTFAKEQPQSALLYTRTSQENFPTMFSWIDKTFWYTFYRSKIDPATLWDCTRVAFRCSKIYFEHRSIPYNLCDSELFFGGGIMRCHMCIAYYHRLEFSRFMTSLFEISKSLSIWWKGVVEGTCFAVNFSSGQFTMEQWAETKTDGAGPTAFQNHNLWSDRFLSIKLDGEGSSSISNRKADRLLYLYIKMTRVTVTGCDASHDAASQSRKVTYYRKRFLYCAWGVWEKRRKWRHHFALKLAMSLHFSLPKIRTFCFSLQTSRLSFLKWSPLWRWNSQWVHTSIAKKCRPLCSDSLKWREPCDEWSQTQEKSLSKWSDPAQS